jgi:S-adenosylmethionine hydrolase
VAEGEPMVLVDSTGFVAVAVRNGSAAQSMQLEIDAPIDVWPISS